MRVEEDKDSASALYKQIRKSALFDKKLGMYKVNANLSKMPEDIGRTRIFPSGWLENESIWLHMEYKYLLELLRNGLYKEFYGDIRTALVPFMDPDVYGRSVLENSSFIASSAHEDVALHGQGFVARLSGSTAEFLHMWLFMNAGRQPFRLDGQGGLQLSLEPALPGEFFTKTAATVTVLDQVDGQKSQTVKLPANTYAFKFMGRTLVVYHNPKRLDTFGSKAVTVQSMHAVYAGGEEASVDGSVVPDALARDIRDGKVARLDVELG
jgi:hypothetical protein